MRYLSLSLCSIGVLLAQLSGTYTIGATGSYTNVSAAITALNSQGISGPVRFEILPDYAGEPGGTTTINVALFGPYPGMGTHSVTLTVHSSVMTPITIATSPSTGLTSRFVFRLNGVDNFIIDGGPNRLLRFQNNSPNSVTGVIGLISDNTFHPNPCRNIVIRNVEIDGQDKTQTRFGIYLGSMGSAFPAAANVNGNNNNRIEGCWIYNVQEGIALWGPSATNRDQNNQVRRCKIGHPSAALSWGGSSYSAGIVAAHQDGLRIERDTVFNASSGTNYGYTGIAVGYTPQSTSSAPCINTHILGNWVYAIRYTGSGGWDAYGIRVHVGSSSPANVYIYNNFIADIATDGYSAPAGTWNAYGLLINGSSNSNAGVYVFHNSIHLFGNVSSSSSTSTPSCLAIRSGITGGVYVRNNIFQNTQTPGSASTSRTTVAIAYEGTSPSVFAQLDNNAYYVNNTNGSQYAYVGALGSNRRASLSDWRTAVGGGREQNSIQLSAAAPFVSNTDLHIPDGTATPIEGGGVLITSPIAILTDIDGNMRPEGSPNPDMGAVEFVQTIPPCPSAIDADQISINPASVTVGTGSSFTISVNNPSNVTLPAQWEISINSGPWAVYAPYNGNPLVYTPTAAGTYDFRLVARVARYHQPPTCTGLQNDTSNVVTGTVTCPSTLNADQISVNPTSVTVGDPVTVTVSNPANVTQPARWEVSIDGGATWNTVASYTGSPFQYTPTVIQPHQIRLAALPPTGCSGLTTTYSNVASFTVLPPRGASINDPIDITPQVPTRTDTTVNGNNSLPGYTNSYTGPGNQSSPDVYYRYILRECLDSIRVSTCNSTNFGGGNDLYLHVINISVNPDRILYTDGGRCGGATTIDQAALDIYHDPNTTGASLVTSTSSYRAGMRLQAGDTLIIIVQGWSSNTGPFVLDVQEYRYNPANQPSLPQPPFFSFDTSRVCYQGGIVRDSLNTGQTNPAFAHVWYLNGQQAAGVTGPIYQPQFTAPGIYEVVVEIRSANLSYCAPTTSIPRDTVYIVVDTLPKVDFLVDGSLYEHAQYVTITGTGTTCVDYQATINNPAFTYTWVINGSTYTGVGPHQECYTPSQSADTVVLITTNGSCIEVDSLYVILDISTGLKAGRDGLTFYPNPTREAVYVRALATGPAAVRLWDMRGQLLFSQEVLLQGGEPIRIALPSLAAGIYMIEVRQGERLLRGRLTIE
ncbi:MAG: hypothetical protein KatS3mg025_0276 [Bacteroidia bacterium]|nr:MAG: hypothetical protein KatS3mg025_0276 [Bacteroidia bacterium]